MMPRYHPTNFVESNALLALMSGDVDGARTILDGMTNVELDELAFAAHDLSHEARKARNMNIEADRRIIARRRDAEQRAMDREA